MRKINKKINITLIFMLIAGACLALLCSDAHALRVPVNNDYDHLDEVMLSNLSVPELIERIYPDYEKYINLLEGFCKRLEGNGEISKADIEEYIRLKKKLGVILNIWNSKVADLWRNSKERGTGLADDRGNKLFLEWKDSAMSEWLKRCDKNMRIKFSFLLKALYLGPEYTPTNHFDVFIKASATDKFVFLQHIHANLTMRDLFILVPLKNAALHMFSGQRSFERDRKDPYQYYVENYGKSVVQFDNNGLFSVPAVDAYIARTIEADKPNDSAQPRLASNDRLFLKGKKILMVEDNPVKGKNTIKYCISLGAETEDITAVESYDIAINALTGSKFDVILLDMEFPILKEKGDYAWAGLSVLEYIVAKNRIAPILINSNSIEYISQIRYQIRINTRKYPNLVALGNKINTFVGIFPMQIISGKRSDDHFRSLLEINLEGLRVSL